MTTRSRSVSTGHVAGMAHPDCAIPLFAENTTHSSVPLDDSAAAARSGGQERPQAGACALLLTAASTTARSPSAHFSNTLRVVARSIAMGVVVAVATSSVDPSIAQRLPAAGVTAAASQPSDPYATYVTEASRRFSIPDRWIRTVMRVESGGDPRAVSKRGAVGLMQIMPATWRELQDRYGLGADPYDPHDNIIAGAAYLREMHDRFGPDGFLAAYNAGPERYVKSRDDGLPLPVETQRYFAMLGPLIDGSRPALIAWPSASEHPWQSSSLFASTTGAAFDNTRRALASLSTRPSCDTIIVDLSALVPTSHDLFVASP